MVKIGEAVPAKGDHRGGRELSDEELEAVAGGGGQILRYVSEFCEVS
jgi:hypothetical protein